MVSIAGATLAQPMGIPVDPPETLPDPTLGTPILCEHYYVPVPGSSGSCDPCPCIRFWPGAVFGNISWVLSNENGWHRDRRPAVMIQFASGGYLYNPRGVDSWWWVTPGNGTTFVPDEAVDEKKPNPDFDVTGSAELISGQNNIPDQFDVLMWRIKKAHAKGIRRIILHNPAGVQGVRYTEMSTPRNGISYPKYGGTDQSMNQFQAMPSWKQSYFRGDTAHPVYYAGREMDMLAWKRFVEEFCTTTPDLEPDKISLEIYCGGGIGSDPCKLNTNATMPNPVPGSSLPHRVRSFKEWEGDIATFQDLWSEPTAANSPYPKPMDPRDAYQLSVFWGQAEPWTESGVKTIWLDAASENIPTNARRWGSVELSHNPYLLSQNIRVGGETLPTIDPSALVPDDCSLAHMRWLTNSQVVMFNYNQPTRTFKQTIQLSKESTECHLFENSSLPLRWNEWREARQRGYVVGLYGGQFNSEIEVLKRWYSLGEIQVADFNGDGYISPFDYTDAWDAVHMPDRQPTDPIVYATGDFLQDGVINEDDWYEFIYYWDINRRTTKKLYHFRD